ncbi:DegT/DnrJ/EryC1/StrS family aminotransferase [Alloacidobacterium dinghuense]|uniref:DegT/DnrJ/EryC1/StrS family aminotransferase n=1 Tax=Alloacidobacterium dinghuense TaxID=2763107 RepID=A0A7G8BDZ2_9BACT|nr:DegT/DnrJ/EryC1/StrS family aminotransferase [Alloacidobacterium dinghuense]QNI30762.1 DegT/DnrJ/EryC1/StrS family aminotransferase [Alloacidobacterium dinghuense]
MRNPVIRVPFVDLKAQYAGLREEMNKAVQNVLDSGHFVGGPVLEKFEREFAEFVGANYCVGVANGTDAITLAARVADLGRGDEVLVPANSFFATAEAISNAGATPVFVDVDPTTFHMDPALAEEAITSRTAAIVPVHLYGRAMNLEPFEALAAKYNLLIIEDCAQAHGASIGSTRIGSSGRLTCYSFYPGKNLGAYGDGGAITTSDPHLTKQLRILREHGSPAKYEHSVVGWNSRLDALQATVLSVKLPHMTKWNSARRDHAKRLVGALTGSPIIPPVIPEGDEHVFHLFVVRCSCRNELKQFLEQKGIQTGIHYPVPLHLTGAYQALDAPGPRSKPVTEGLASEILSLPMYPELSEEQISDVISALQEFIHLFRPTTPRDFMTEPASQTISYNI